MAQPLFNCFDLRYEGVDERVYALADQEISIGDYVLWRELGAAVMIDTITRLIPGALGRSSARQESFSAALPLCLAVQERLWSWAGQYRWSGGLPDYP